MSSELVPGADSPGPLARQAPAGYLSGPSGGGGIRLGSRTSPMAMAQARHVAALIARLAGTDPDIVPIETSADQWHGDLAALGGKGAFVKEIDRALLTGRIDVAVHCMKDVPGDVPLPPGTVFAAYLPRDDARDCAVFPASSPRRRLDDLPPGARIGSSAVRRKAQLGALRPDLAVHRVRGNVNSRIARLDNGEFDALILARAGLERVGMAGRATETLPAEVMCPAVGAGVIGLQCRTADRAEIELLGLLDDRDARIRVTAERVMLHGLQGHCNSPIAGHAVTTPDGQLSLRGMVFTPDGGEFVHATERGEAARPAELGAHVAGVLLKKGARDLIAGIAH